MVYQNQKNRTWGRLPCFCSISCNVSHVCAPYTLEVCQLRTSCHYTSLVPTRNCKFGNLYLLASQNFSDNVPSKFKLPKNDQNWGVGSIYGTNKHPSGSNRLLARGKNRGFSHGAAARHLKSARVSKVFFGSW